MGRSNHDRFNKSVHSLSNRRERRLKSSIRVKRAIRIQDGFPPESSFSLCRTRLKQPYAFRTTACIPHADITTEEFLVSCTESGDEMSSMSGAFNSNAPLPSRHVGACRKHSTAFPLFDAKALISPFPTQLVQGTLRAGPRPTTRSRSRGERLASSRRSFAGRAGSGRPLGVLDTFLCKPKTLQ